MHSDSYFRIELIFFPRLYEIQRKNCSKCREVKRQIALFCVHVNDSDNKWTNNMMKLSKDSPVFYMTLMLNWELLINRVFIWEQQFLYLILIMCFQWESFFSYLFNNCVYYNKWLKLQTQVFTVQLLCFVGCLIFVSVLPIRYCTGTLTWHSWIHYKDCQIAKEFVRQSVHMRMN